MNALMLLAAAACISWETGLDPASMDTGVTRAYDVTLTPGFHTLLDAEGTSLGVLDGFHLDGEFIGPAIVADLGDTVEFTLTNTADDAVALSADGLSGTPSQDQRIARPGETATWIWKADQGPGTFLYYSSMVDEDGTYSQARSGLLGVVVVRDFVEDAAWDPTHMVNANFLDLYEPAFTWMHPEDEPLVEGSVPSLVLQEVRGTRGHTTTREDGVATARDGDVIRLNAASFGTAEHALYFEGHGLHEAETGRTLSVLGLAPGEASRVYVELDSPGMWPLYSRVDEEHLTTTAWLHIEGPGG